MKPNTPHRFRIEIDDWKQAFNMPIELGFRPSGVDASLLYHDDLSCSGTGVMARVEERAVLLITDRHANAYDRSVAKKAADMLRARLPIRDNTHEG